MYCIDSAVYRVDVFDFELSSGRFNERRPFVSIEKSDGIPDGLTADDEDGSLFVTTEVPDGNVYAPQPGVNGPPAHVFHAGGTRTAPSDAEDTSAR